MGTNHLKYDACSSSTFIVLDELVTSDNNQKIFIFLLTHGAIHELFCVKVKPE